MVRKREKGMKETFFGGGGPFFCPSFYLHAKVIILIRVWERRKNCASTRTPGTEETVT